MNNEIASERVRLKGRQSVHAKQGQLIISARTASWLGGKVDVVVGRVGFESLARTLQVGDAVLFETPDAGLFEIRLMNIQVGSDDTADLMITNLVPGVAPIAGFRSSDSHYENEPFHPDEVRRLQASLEHVSQSVRSRNDLRDEQIDFINRKLDEMADAATRVGRRDWINLAVGTLTNVVVATAIGSDAARFLFQSVSDALAWLFGEGLKLLS